jgi:hypothetical protein
MADGFIVRKGGAVTEQALAPTITEVSTTKTSITFTITNNDASTAVILYEIGDATPDENSIELATGVTSDSIEITGLDEGTEYTVSATASVTGKVLSNVTSLAIETDADVYTAATGGTTLEYDLDGKRYKSHTFTSDDDFVVTTVGDATGDRNQVDYLIIAAGGSGGSCSGGGGGAGGYRTTITPTPSDEAVNAKITVTATTFGVVIGAGGVNAWSGCSNTGNNGTNSSALGITATGGGTGGKFLDNGGNGGSGGGGGSDGNTTGGTGILGQGRNGGNGITGSPNERPPGGGGGAGAVGANGTTGVAGNGGNGLANLLRTGSNETRAGGGGAAIVNGTAGTGGSGGGGNGASSTGSGSNATANTGSGGGGGNAVTDTDAGSGGSGIVIIRYEIAPSV